MSYVIIAFVNVENGNGKYDQNRPNCDFLLLLLSNVPYFILKKKKIVNFKNFIKIVMFYSFYTTKRNHKKMEMVGA